jgi:hypothetical protein
MNMLELYTCEVYYFYLCISPNSLNNVQFTSSLNYSQFYAKDKFSQYGTMWVGEDIFVKAYC